MSINRYFEHIGAWPAQTHSLRASYVWGFILSLVLTIASYALALHHDAPRGVLIALILALACVQFAVQLLFFFHLGRETVSRERFIVLGCAILIVFIIVAGSLWIMFTLNDRMTPSVEDMERYMRSQQGI